MAGKISNKDRWVTMNGRHLLIKAGETPEEAYDRNIKETANSEIDRQEKEIAEREKQTEKLTAEKNANEAPTYTKDGVTYSIERGNGGVYLGMKSGKGFTKNKILSPNDPEKARVKLTGKGLIYLKSDPKMLKLLKNS